MSKVRFGGPDARRSGPGLLDLHDPRVAVAPLAAHHRDALVGCQVDDGVGPDRGNVGRDLRQRTTRDELRNGEADKQHASIHDRHLTFTT
jgi:hypothetical protein